MPEGQGVARPRSPSDAGIVAACLCIFAFSAQVGGIASYVGCAALVGAAIAVVLSLRQAGRPHRLLGLGGWTSWMAGWASIAAAAGMALGIVCRSAYQQDAWPKGFTGFAIAAAAIGATEELVYRGYIQGRLASWGAPAAVAGAAFAHAAYKLAVFLGGPSGVHVNYLCLALATFLGGLALGALRRLSRSVVPSVAFHVAFDIVLYGDRLEAPWWVWG